MGASKVAGPTHDLETAKLLVQRIRSSRPGRRWAIAIGQLDTFPVLAVTRGGRETAASALRRMRFERGKEPKEVRRDHFVAATSGFVHIQNKQLILACRVKPQIGLLSRLARYFKHFRLPVPWRRVVLRQLHESDEGDVWDTATEGVDVPDAGAGGEQTDSQMLEEFAVADEWDAAPTFLEPQRETQPTASEAKASSAPAQDEMEPLAQRPADIAVAELMRIAIELATGTGALALDEHPDSSRIAAMVATHLQPGVSVETVITRISGLLRQTLRSAGPEWLRGLLGLPRVMPSLAPVRPHVEPEHEPAVQSVAEPSTSRFALFEPLVPEAPTKDDVILYLTKLVANYVEAPNVQVADVSGAATPIIMRLVEARLSAGKSTVEALLEIARIIDEKGSANDVAWLRGLLQLPKKPTLEEICGRLRTEWVEARDTAIVALTAYRVAVEQALAAVGWPSVTENGASWAQLELLASMLDSWRLDQLLQSVPVSDAAGRATTFAAVRTELQHQLASISESDAVVAALDDHRLDAPTGAFREFRATLSNIASTLNALPA
jgi:hypothetical protein